MDIGSIVSEGVTLANANALLSFEGPNEPNNFPIKYDNATGGGSLSATYIHNMTTILADIVSKPPSSMNYSIPAEPATVHDLLMQKSDGTFYLAVWDERVPGTGTDNLTVNLGKPHASVKIYDPTIGTAAVQMLTDVSSIPLTLSDHLQILAISNQ